MNLEKFLYRTTSIGGRLLAESAKIDPTQSLQYQRSQEHGFKRRNYERWQQGIDLLERFLIFNREAGEDSAKDYIENNEVSEDYQFKALLFLHARACQSTHEILTLIKNGFADGAYARWRNLYETAAIASFIKQEKEAGERFLDYRHIEDYHRAQTYQEYAETGELPLQPFTEEDIQILEDNRNKMVDKYDDDFDDGGRGYGWANYYFDHAHVSAIAEETGLKNLKPYYELTHKLIHSGSTGATYSMGTVQNFYEQADSEVSKNYRVLAGPSNYGFADAAQNTAISLSQVSAALITIAPTPLRLIILQAINELVSDIQRSFVRIQQQIEKEEKDLYQ